MSIAIPLYADVIQSRKILATAKGWIKTIPKGDVGATGLTGVMGMTGATGETGLSLAGAKGATGDTGVAGATGLTGAQGSKGDLGATGAKGEEGAQGETGSNGVKGDTGATGVTGSTGSGVTGLVGATVLKGDGGPKGENGTISDRRLKRDITDDVPGMEFVRALEPKRFRYTAESNLDNYIHTGFVAQDIQSASKATGVPVDDMALVNTSGQYLSLNLGEMHAIEVKSIQNLDTRVSVLENAK